MDCYEIEPRPLAGEHTGKWSLTITRLSNCGTDEIPWYGGPIFDSERDALRYGVNWVESHGGLVRKAVLQRATGRVNPAGVRDKIDDE